MKTIRLKGKKACWVATETRAGWRLKFCVGAKDYPLRGLLLRTREDVERVASDYGIVFVHLSNSKTVPK